MIDMKAIKKPIEVEVYQWNGDFLEAPEWIKDALRNKIIIDDRSVKDKIIIVTLEGNHICSLHDYIIKGVNGELYPCKPDIFEKTYDIVE